MNHEIPKSVFDLLSSHIGHSVELVGYGKGGNPPWVDLALECHECDAVIADWTVPEEKHVRKAVQRRHSH